MKSLPMTVLFYDGPQARAYLAGLRRAGYRPERVLRLVSSLHPSTQKPLGRWLPQRWRVRYAEKAGEFALNYWPRQIRSRHPELVATMGNALREVYAEAPELIDEILSGFDVSRYTADVRRVFARGLDDPALAQALADVSPTTVLYTGGGILRDNLLGLPDIRFLHVHPGFLPDVRGADGLLWSTLVRGRPGASSFYMGRGIDTGEIISAKDYPFLSFDIAGQSRPADKTLYRALFSFCDPILRTAHLVRETLKDDSDLSQLPGEVQPPHGLTYHFMHPRLQETALRAIFRS